MGSEALHTIAGVLTAVIGVAIIAVLVSNRAATAGVITAGGNAFSGMLSAATKPVIG